MIRIMYSCDKCGIDRRGLLLEERKPNEDIHHWITTVMNPRLALDHSEQSPNCYTRTLTKVWIPVDNETGGPIGVAPKEKK